MPAKTGPAQLPRFLAVLLRAIGGNGAASAGVVLGGLTAGPTGRTAAAAARLAAICALLAIAAALAAARDGWKF
jgi:hypothetical protein